MGVFKIEHSRLAYALDFALYGVAVLMLATFLVLALPAERQASTMGLVLLGLGAWTLIEYGLHRYVLHGLQPFARWHAEHHQRPTALICSPTILSATLVVGLVLLPAWWAFGVWVACALTLGVLAGYLAYAITHHATHHWRADNAWLHERKRWHALHHRRGGAPACYGVTSGFWDRMFGSTPQERGASAIR
jgi:cyclopropane-fatty-acyl-phospholipid synthase